LRELLQWLLLLLLLLLWLLQLLWDVLVWCWWLLEACKGEVLLFCRTLLLVSMIWLCHLLPPVGQFTSTYVSLTGLSYVFRRSQA
jgi:hypothetical protein